MSSRRDFNSDPRIDVLLTEVFLYGADFSNTRKPAEGVTATACETKDEARILASKKTTRVFIEEATPPES